jgi:hypothetical protein
MTVSQKVIELLNKDEQAKRMNTLFNETAAKQGLTGSELENARQTFLMMLIAKNPEAMSLMANEVWEHHNNI